MLQWQESLPDNDGTTIQDVARLAHCSLGAWRPHHELILQISCNIFLAFKWIFMMKSGHNISHYTTAKLSVHMWNHDLIWWQNKIDTQNHFHKTTITSPQILSKTKLRITIVKEQTPLNPFQNSRTAGRWSNFLALPHTLPLTSGKMAATLQATFWNAFEWWF